MNECTKRRKNFHLKKKRKKPKIYWMNGMKKYLIGEKEYQDE